MEILQTKFYLLGFFFLYFLVFLANKYAYVHLHLCFIAWYLSFIPFAYALILQKIYLNEKIINKNLGKKPLVGIGPMSTNCINSVIELSKKSITNNANPSRRQIDYNTGYVGNLSTKKLSN